MYMNEEWSESGTADVATANEQREFAGTPAKKKNGDKNGLQTN